MVSVFQYASWANLRRRFPVWTRPLLNAAREYSILAFRPYVTSLQFSGQGEAGPLTVSYVTNGGDYKLKLFLQSLLFKEEPVEGKPSRVPLWQLGRLIHNPTSDITFINANKGLLNRLPAKNAILLPRLVDQVLDTRGSWEGLLQRFHKTIRRNELRLVRKYGYEYEIFDKDADFEMFFHQMYRPSMITRHNRQASLFSYSKAYQFFKQGVLLLVRRQRTYVSGGICDIKRERGVVHFLIEGVINADQQLLAEGAQSALYYAVIHWANQHHYKAVDFEATEPYLTKGILQYKRKWGVEARVNSNRRLWIGIHCLTPAVVQFLKDNPCITISDRGHLHGLFFTDEPDNVSADTREAWKKLCNMPGLQGFKIHSVKDFLT